MNAKTDLPFEETTYGVRKRVRVILEWLERVRSQRDGALEILDYGCGTGYLLTEPLARFGGDRVLGVDRHLPSIERAREESDLPHLDYLAGTLDDLLEQDRRFDVVVCSEVLEHVHDPEHHLRGFRELLVEPGFLIMTVPNGKGAFERLKTLERSRVGRLANRAIWSARWVLRRLRDRPPPPRDVPETEESTGFLDTESGHVQFYRLPDLDALFADAGFEVVDARGRSLACGPYLDLVNYFPLRIWILRANNALADWLPMRFSAGWMFLLRKSERICVES